MNIAPSILDADFDNLQEELDSLSACDRIHLDVMDGEYVPSTSFFAEDLDGYSFPVPTEVHLMTEDPGQYFDSFCELGCMGITFHRETQGEKETLELLRDIKDLGMQAGICIDGYTETEELTQEMLQLADQVLIMTVKAGKGGQSFMEENLDKIDELRDRGFEGEIEIDGGVNDETWKLAADAGADVAVVGSFLMKADNTARQERITKLSSL